MASKDAVLATYKRRRMNCIEGALLSDSPAMIVVRIADTIPVSKKSTRVIESIGRV